MNGLELFWCFLRTRKLEQVLMDWPHIFLNFVVFLFRSIASGVLCNTNNPPNGANLNKWSFYLLGIADPPLNEEQDNHYTNLKSHQFQLKSLFVFYDLLYS